jgi:heme a synthase
MEGPGLHRYTVLLAACTLFLIVTGASVTNTSEFFPEPVHRDIGISVGILTIGLAIWLSRGDRRGWLRRLGWISVAMIAAEAIIGRHDVLQAAPRAFGIVHACLAQFFFCAVVAIAVFTSRNWHQGPEPVQDHGWPSLRSLSIVTPLLVLSQVTLGAFLRHRSLGATPHIISAMIVAFLVLAVGVFVTQQFPDHRSLRPAAIAMMGITLAQVFLGIGALTTRMVGEENGLPVKLSTAAHVTTGALTLAASVVIAILIRRHVRAAEPHVADSLQRL